VERFVTGLVFKRVIATIGAALALAMPGVGLAATVDCPPKARPAIASGLPTGTPAPRPTMAGRAVRSEERGEGKESRSR